MFYRESRGVQAISAWLSSGGAGREFNEMISQILREDQRVEPLVGGLVDVTIVLLHMLASTLNTSAEAIVGGILDLYATQE
jgi:hypothetical protein